MDKTADSGHADPTQNPTERGRSGCLAR